MPKPEIIITRAEISLILLINKEIERFNNSDFWTRPEEELRFRALGIKEQTDRKDTIGLNILNSDSIETGLSESSFELEILKELKEKGVKVD